MENWGLGEDIEGRVNLTPFVCNINFDSLKFYAVLELKLEHFDDSSARVSRWASVSCVNEQSLMLSIHPFVRQFIHT